MVSSWSVAKGSGRCSGQSPRSPPGPAGVGMAGQVGVVIARITGYLGANPGRQGDRLVDPLQFDLGENQTVVGTEKFVDLPGQSGVRDPVAVFLDERLQTALLEQHLGISGQDGEFELGAGQPVAMPLDRQDRGTAADADPHRTLRIGTQVALPVEGAALRRAPGLAADQKLALNLDFHRQVVIGAVAAARPAGSVRACRRAWSRRYGRRICRTCDWPPRTAPRTSPPGIGPCWFPPQ